MYTHLEYAKYSFLIPEGYTQDDMVSVIKESCNTPGGKLPSEDKHPVLKELPQFTKMLIQRNCHLPKDFEFANQLTRTVHGDDVGFSITVIPTSFCRATPHEVCFFSTSSKNPFGIK